MRAAFADSNFYVALLISRDSNHAAAAELAGSWTGVEEQGLADAFTMDHHFEQAGFNVHMR